MQLNFPFIFSIVFLLHLISYIDTRNTHTFPMRVSDISIGKILIVDIARICRHDGSVMNTKGGDFLKL